VDLGAFKQETIRELRQKMEEVFRQQSRVAGDLRQATEDILFATLREVFTTWRRQEIDKLAQKLADTHQDFASRINAILERLTRLTARIFDFSLRGFAAEEAFPDLRQFWFKFKDEPVGLEILQMTVTALLPRALTKGLLLKKLLENVGELVDKHCGRLRYDFHQRLQEIARDFRQTWLSKIDDTTHSIRQALDRALAQKQASAQTTAARMGQLDQRLEEIIRAESQLLSLKEEVEAAL
jgi:hemerythrin superfamily protein